MATEQGIQQVELAYMPEYASLDARIRSFRHWTYGHVQEPKRLAEAGFYYAGVADEVRCFHCDGGLRDWLVTDDPWHEHIRCFAGCSFLQLVLGETYINHVLHNGNEVASTNVPGTSTSVPENSATTRLAIDDDVTHRLQEENSRLREERECKICLTREVGVVFCPCGHLVSCVQCAPAIYNCPVCRALITGRIRTFLS
uniref:RING-type domain-containing protein n=1 Tax=Anopheles farauti TaxID=69004 RepID=A0A182QLR8_9DIPT